MGRLSSISLPILLLAVLAAAAAAFPSPSLVEKTCREALAGSSDYEDCVRILNSSLESKNATDARDLVIVFGNLTRANVSDTMSSMKELILNLNSCLKMYTVMNYELGTTLNWIKAGNLTGVHSALSRIMRMPGGCDIVQSKNTYGKQPFLDEDKDALFMARLVRGLFVSVYGKPPAGGQAK